MPRAALGLTVVAGLQVFAAAVLALTGVISWGATLAWLAPSLAVIWLLSRLVGRRQVASAGEAAIDSRGVWWTDRWGGRHGFDRASVVGYRIGLEPNTERLAPALTLFLTGGHESQPIELAAPANPPGVRAFLDSHWRLQEQPGDEEAVAKRLREALESFADAWPPAPEKRLLMQAVVPPVRRDRFWLVAESASLGQAFYEPGAGVFQWRDPSGAAAEAADGEALLQLLRERLVQADPAMVAAVDSLLPDHPAWWKENARRHAFAEFLVRELAGAASGPPQAIELRITRQRGSSLEFEGELREASELWEIAGEAHWQDEPQQFAGYVDAWSASERANWQAQVEREALDLGLRIEMDNDAGAWRLTGSRTALLAWARELGEAARDEAPIPTGAKPRRLRVGGSAMWMEVEIGPGWWIDGRTLRIEPRRLAEFAETLQRLVVDAPAGERVATSLFDDPKRPRQAWRFELLVEPM